MIQGIVDTWLPKGKVGVGVRDILRLLGFETSSTGLGLLWEQVQTHLQSLQESGSSEPVVISDMKAFFELAGYLSLTGIVLPEFLDDQTVGASVSGWAVMPVINSPANLSYVVAYLQTLSRLGYDKAVVLTRFNLEATAATGLLKPFLPREASLIVVPPGSSYEADPFAKIGGLFFQQSVLFLAPQPFGLINALWARRHLMAYLSKGRKGNMQPPSMVLGPQVGSLTQDSGLAVIRAIAQVLGELLLTPDRGVSLGGPVSAF